MVALLSSRRGIWGHAAAADILIMPKLLLHRPFSTPNPILPLLTLTSSLYPPPFRVSFHVPSYSSLPRNARLSHLHSTVLTELFHCTVNTVILPTDGLTGRETCLLLTNGESGYRDVTPLLVRHYFGHCQPLSFSLPPSPSYTMQSSTLYGPVTKVTVGKYFVQVANKGFDKTKEKGSSKGRGGRKRRSEWKGKKWKKWRNGQKRKRFRG